MHVFNVQYCLVRTYPNINYPKLANLEELFIDQEAINFRKLIGAKMEILLREKLQNLKFFSVLYLVIV